MSDTLKQTNFRIIKRDALEALHYFGPMTACQIKDKLLMRHACISDESLNQALNELKETQDIRETNGLFAKN